MRSHALLLLLACGLAAAGCIGGGDDPAPPTTVTPAGEGGNATLTVESAAFAEGGDIPVQHTCDGDDLSPPLRVSGLPAGATSVALTVLDHDVPTPLTPVRTVTHWLIWNLTPAANGTVEIPGGAAPNGSVEGANEGGESGWMGPCPPVGSPEHRYTFTAYALDGPVNVSAGASRADLEAALDGRTLGTGQLVGTYARQAPVP